MQHVFITQCPRGFCIRSERGERIVTFPVMIFRADVPPRLEPHAWSEKRYLYSIHVTTQRLPVLTRLKKQSDALGRDFIARPNDVFRPHGLRAYPDPLAWTYIYAVSNVSCWDDSVSCVTAKDASLSRFNVLLCIQTIRHFKIVDLWTVYVDRLVYHTSV